MYVISDTSEFRDSSCFKLMLLTRYLKLCFKSFVGYLVCVCAHHPEVAGEHRHPLHPAVSEQCVGRVIVLYFPPVHFEL